MKDENISQEFRLKSIDKISHYFKEYVNLNGLNSKKHKKVFRAFNYIEHLLILVSADTWCITISAFASLVGIPEDITSLQWD